ncbi:MAG: lysophospholipid acyltransferase family protein [Verrucomicrobia bacterium]|nr:lysophospholipid acyltransferase family protein [Verrucomicrobiota bacterium]MDA1067027.1 lysophospholipid acyltransferase family protein [Verrucomicrobiota bacterium]
MPTETAAQNPIPLKAYCIAVLLRGITLLLASTYRIRFSEGEGRIKELLERTDPVILCAWHNRVFFLSRFVEKHLTRKGFRLTQMVSLSKDGNFGYLLGKWAKLRVVRGSSNRGGSKALRGLFREVQKERSSILILPDGSQGPIYKAKAGAIVLAQLSGAPLCLFSCDADRAWRVKSWDKLIVPKPFARITVRIPALYYIPRDLDKTQLEMERKKLEDQLNELNGSS